MYIDEGTNKLLKIKSKQKKKLQKIWISFTNLIDDPLF